jgi:hypothetical protein
MSTRSSVGAADAEILGSTLAWLSDSEVKLFIERLPLAQRQVITLRYLIGLELDEVADVLGRSPGSVRQLDLRARQYLQERLTALGRKPSRGSAPEPASAPPPRARAARTPVRAAAVVPKGAWSMSIDCAGRTHESQPNENERGTP